MELFCYHLQGTRAEILLVSSMVLAVCAVYLQISCLKIMSTKVDEPAMQTADITLNN